MERILKCPVCGKPLTEAEYDKALGLWKEKQEHIKHLEEEQQKLKDKEKNIRKSLDAERKKLRLQEAQFRQRTQQQARQFKSEQAKLRKETRGSP